MSTLWPRRSGHPPVPARGALFLPNGRYMGLISTLRHLHTISDDRLYQHATPTGHTSRRYTSYILYSTRSLHAAPAAARRTSTQMGGLRRDTERSTASGARRL